MKLSFIVISSVLVSYVWASIACNSSSSCPEDTPCCSQYGVCGTGSTCLGGCHPAYSYSKEACMPMPVCKNLTTVFDSTDGLINEDDYLGDPTDGDWIYNGYIDSYDDSLLIAMPNQTSGTVVSSTRYVWFGKISATLKTSHLAGVITAFILYSNAEDEIDYEFVGSALTSAESNFYYEAVLNYSNVVTENTTNTYENYHTYEIDWTPEELTWSLDGEAFRTLKKEDTWNTSTDSYHYPQSPSRVQISLWPGGDASNGVGTIEWAGGSIDWDSDDIKDYGYYYMLLKNITIECYSPPDDTEIEGDVSYMYNSSQYFDQEYIYITDEDTVLGSQDASGLDPDAGKSSSGSSTKTTSKSSGSTSTKSGSDSTDTGSSADSGDSTSSGSDSTGFVQFASTSTSATESSNTASLYAGSSLLALFISIMTFATTL